MKMKRFLSTLLVICMLATLVPAASAAQTTVLYTVDVSGVPQQVMGKNTTDMLTFDVPLGVMYDAKWEDADRNNYEGVLEIGSTYYLCIYLYAEEGYAFDLDAEILLDVDESVPFVWNVYTDVADTDYIFIEVTYQLTESMPDIEICGITAPVAGQLPTVKGLSVPEGVEYSIESAKWYYWNENDEWTEVSEAFAAAETYYLELDMALPAGYVLTMDTNYMWNAVTDGYSAYEDILTLDFYVPGKSIAELSVEGVPEEIQAGQQASIADITIPEDAPYTLEVNWETAVDGDWSAFEGTFQENGFYRLNLEFYSAEGYQMDVEEIYVNGALADYYGQSNSWLGMEILYPLTQEIAEVELLSVQEPKAGEQANASAIQVPEGANYSIEYAYWYDTDTYEAVTGSFEKGKAYALDVKLVPNEGYHFAQEVVLTVNGQVSDEYYNELLYVNYWHTESLKELIEQVKVEIGEVEVGKAVPTEVTIPADAKYTAEFDWFVWNGEEFEVFEGAVFTDGNIYGLDIAVYPDAGYEIVQGKTQIELVGQDPLCNYWNEGVDILMLYFFGVENVVNKIELNNVQLPEVGKTATVAGITLPEDAGYELEQAYWIESNTGDLINGSWSDADTFRAGKYYGLILVLQTTQSNVMGWKVPLYINGQEVQPQIREGAVYYEMVGVVFGPMEEETVAGDFTGDGEVTNEDVVHLLWHILFAEQYPITSNGDFTGDGEVTNEDVVYLLWHTLFSENYPL